MLRLVKKNNGSALVVVLMIIVVFAILSIAIGTFAINENRQAVRQQKKMQAYYLARAGASATAKYIDSLDENQLEEFASKLPLISEDTAFGEGSFSIIVKKGETNADLEIESTGKVLSVKDEIGSPMYITETVTLLLEKSSNTLVGEVEISTAIFSKGKITVFGNALIKGDIGTNSTNINDIQIEKEDKFEGEKHIGVNTNYPNIIIPDISEILPSATETYDTFTIDRNVIDTTSGDIIIVANEVNFNGDLTIKGSNKLKLFVKNSIYFENNTKVNKKGEPRNLEIYFYGDEFEMNTNGSISANIYVSAGNMSIKGTPALKGNIFSNGNYLNLKAKLSGEAYEGSIYAPNAFISIENSNSMNMKGAIVGEKIEIKGNPKITCDDKIILPINADDSTIDNDSKYKIKYWH